MRTGGSPARLHAITVWLHAAASARAVNAMSAIGPPNPPETPPSGHATP